MRSKQLRLVFKEGFYQIIRKGFFHIGITDNDIPNGASLDIRLLAGVSLGGDNPGNVERPEFFSYLGDRVSKAEQLYLDSGSRCQIGYRG